MHYDCLIVDDETAIASSTSEYFNLFELSSAYVTSYEQCIDFLMIAKYFERIGDHAVNIAEWVVFSLTGEHKNHRIL